MTFAARQTESIDEIHIVWNKYICASNDLIAVYECNFFPLSRCLFQALTKWPVVTSAYFTAIQKITINCFDLIALLQILCQNVKQKEKEAEKTS